MSLAGNGFSLPCGAAVVAWTFAHAVSASVNEIGRPLPVADSSVDNSHANDDEGLDVNPAAGSVDTPRHRVRRKRKE